MNNRKGAAKDIITFFPFLFFLVIIAGGIVLGTVIFYGSGYDIRQSEAEVLNYKIGNCILEKQGWEDNIYDFCGIVNKEVLGEIDVLFKVCKESGDCILEKSEEKIVVTTGGDFVSCGLEGEVSEGYGKCSIGEVEKSGVRYQVISFSGNQIRGENVGR
jgi:hypothetical protein